MERRGCLFGLVVVGVLGVSGGWERWASEGKSGDEMAVSFKRGLLSDEAETSPLGRQGSSRMGDLVPDICDDDVVDVCDCSFGGGDRVDDVRPLTCCVDDRRDSLAASRAKLTDDLRRLGSCSWVSGTS